LLRKGLRGKSPNSLIEKIVFGEIPCPDNKSAQLVEEIKDILVELTPQFQSLADAVFNLYKKRITYTPVDMETFWEDLRQECWMGLWRALLRFDPTVYPHNPDAYITKVIRSHVKVTPIGVFLHIARVPHSRWKHLTPEQKAALSYNHNLTQEEDENEGNSIEFPDNGGFSIDEIEWRDFRDKLPPLFRIAVDAVELGEGSGWLLPKPIVNLLAYCALVIFRRS